MANTIVKKIVDGQSLAANFNSQIIPVGPYVDNIAFNVNATSVSTNSGTFKVQHRIFDSRTNRASAWADLCLTDDPTLENVDLVRLIYLNQVPLGQLRIVFTVAGSSPDGVVDIWYSGREL